FEAMDVERILELVPLATHNQRGRGTLYVGSDHPVNAEQLAGIVEGSMSSPIYELLKRPDELFVVEHAHLQPRFVEDSVRISLQSTLERYAELEDADFLLARQVNFETIHSHEVVAERYGTVGELRAELESGQTAAPMPPTTGATPRKAPPQVATIFPPRCQRKKSGRQCPSIAAAPASTPVRWDTVIVATNAGTNPFAVSKRTTGSPSRQP